MFNNFYTFIQNLNHILIMRLYDYFYKNSFEYSEQRHFFKTTKLVFNVKSLENKSLFDYLQDRTIIEHIYNNFKNKIESDNKMKLMYLRFYVMIILSSLTFYLIYQILMNKISSNYSSILFINILIIILISTLFSARFTYKREKEDPNYNHFPIYVYTKKYEIIFWLLTLLQCYFFWKILFKPYLVFMSSETLINIPFDLLKITKIYTNEEKILYLYQYFENNVKIYISVDPEYMRHILRQIDFNYLFNNNITLLDIQAYLNILFTNHDALISFIHNYCEAYLEFLKTLEKECIENQKQVDYYKDLFKDVILYFIENFKP